MASAALILGEQAKTDKAYKLVLDEQAKTEAAYQLVLEAKAKTETALRSAAAAAASAQQRAEEAEARLRLARRSVDELFQLSEEELANWGGMERLRKRVLDSVSDLLSGVNGAKSDDPKAQEELRETKAQVEKIIADLAVLQAAEHFPLAEPTGRATPTWPVRGSANEDQGDVGSSSTGGRGGPLHGSWPRFSPTSGASRTSTGPATRNAEMLQVLTQEQLQRLPQIALQLQGMGAFRQADVAAALKLTPNNASASATSKTKCSGPG